MYFPLPIDPDTLRGRRNHPQKEFSGKGIASMIETRALEHVRKLFPQAKRISIYKPQMAMVKRIRKLGFNYKEEIKLAKFRSTLRNKVASNIRKARAKRLVALRH